jgi:hypothetical protein
MSAQLAAIARFGGLRSGLPALSDRQTDLELLAVRGDMI